MVQDTEWGHIYQVLKTRFLAAQLPYLLYCGIDTQGREEIILANLNYIVNSNHN